MIADQSYRSLTRQEISKLAENNCTSDNWGDISVKKGFDASRCINVHFSGKIRLGIFNEGITDSAGIMHPSGLYNSHIHNCSIGSNSSIYNISDYLANYEIGERVLIRNCGKIYTEGTSSFGNGTVVSVMSEAGTRALKIWDRLSAHQAYISAFYMHRPLVIRKIEEMTDEYIAKITSSTGYVGDGSVILNCGQIRNVSIGPSSRLEGAARLNEGTVNSSMQDPVFIGSGVIMDHFIICSGSKVTDATIIDKCFIGQGCVLGKQFSAENSLFFANCAGFHGEACSVFAGPYTVTHHKSTLLIAGMFSFMNAGSGSNQSNHMYRLGPVHQGILERGSKTASDSYLLWPSRIGPYTLVVGRHHKNIDTTFFPFSYLVENNDQTILIPGINLRSVGTIRDAQKWPQRDLRKDPSILDLLNFDLLNPYTVRKMISGRDLLKKIRQEQGKKAENYSYLDVKINRKALERGINLYQIGIEKFLGNLLIKRIAGLESDKIDEALEKLAQNSLNGRGDWIDLAGLIVPKNEVERLLDDIESGKIKALDGISAELGKMHDSYSEWSWAWASEKLEAETGKRFTEFTYSDLKEVILKWEKSVLELDEMLYEDAKKEFTHSSMTGFGIDGGDDDKQIDFEHVRGSHESNPAVLAILNHMKEKKALSEKILKMIGNSK